MKKKLLVTRTIDKVQYQLYQTQKLHLVTLHDYRGIHYEEKIQINAYGITVLLSLGQEVVHYDSGPLSAQNYEVNYLFHKLTRLQLLDLDEIREVIWSEYTDWCNNRYGNPFDKKAAQVLKTQIRTTLNKGF